MSRKTRHAIALFTAMLGTVDMAWKTGGSDAGARIIAIVKILPPTVTLEICQLISEDRVV